MHHLTDTNDPDGTDVKHQWRDWVLAKRVGSECEASPSIVAMELFQEIEGDC